MIFFLRLLLAAKEGWALDLLRFRFIMPASTSTSRKVSEAMVIIQPLTISCGHRDATAAATPTLHLLLKVPAVLR